MVANVALFGKWRGFEGEERRSRRAEEEGGGGVGG
jgi:hypothetical protein